MTFSEYVRKVRRGLDMSQHELAEELNVNYTTVNRWENKRVIPSNLAKKSFIEFCKVKEIDMPTEILVDGTDTDYKDLAPSRLSFINSRRNLKC